MLKFGFTESEYKVFLYDHDDFNSMFFWVPGSKRWHDLDGEVTFLRLAELLAVELKIHSQVSALAALCKHLCLTLLKEVLVCPFPG